MFESGGKCFKPTRCLSLTQACVQCFKPARCFNPMYPSDFKESNKVIDKPPDMSVDECEPLNVFTGKMPDGSPVIISCFKPTADELEKIKRTGRVWVWHFGSQLQPHAISGDNPFE